MTSLRGCLAASLSTVVVLSLSLTAPPASAAPATLPVTSGAPSPATVALPTGVAASTVAVPEGQWPLHPHPPVVHEFDPPVETWAAGHRGVDLRGSVGQPVRAALPGRVWFTGRIAGVAVVVVSHGSTRTTYQPVVPAVERGTEVAPGAVIGHLEWHGTHCMPAACLHWGLLEGDRYLDPLSVVKGGPRPVRLLPLDGGGWSRAGSWDRVSRSGRSPSTVVSERWHGSVRGSVHGPWYAQPSSRPLGPGLARFGVSPTGPP